MNCYTRIDGERKLESGEWEPKSAKQSARAAGAAGVLEWRYALAVTDLPQWLHAELKSMGLRVARRIGSTTYVKSVWRLESISNA